MQQIIIAVSEYNESYVALLNAILHFLCPSPIAIRWRVYPFGDSVYWTAQYAVLPNTLCYENECQLDRHAVYRRRDMSRQQVCRPHSKSKSKSRYGCRCTISNSSIIYFWNILHVVFSECCSFVYTANVFKRRSVLEENHDDVSVNKTTALRKHYMQNVSKIYYYLKFFVCFIIFHISTMYWWIKMIIT